VVSACDTPLVPAAFYRNALAALPGHDGVMAHVEAPEPLISAWRRAATLPEALRLAAEGRGPRALAETLKVRLVQSDELSAWGAKSWQMASANTPEALARLAAFARAKGAYG
jgi:molybdopterin-guanine dinucleotide biosynthesis protein A